VPLLSSHRPSAVQPRAAVAQFAVQVPLLSLS
jgi:hypothetical protein